MPRSPAAYPPAYGEQIIALARAGRSAKELAAEFEPSEQTIRNWLFQAEADPGERPGTLTTAEHDELIRLRRENRQLKVERDIPGKAAAWFATESPPRLPQFVRSPTSADASGSQRRRDRSRPFASRLACLREGRPRVLCVTLSRRP